MAERQRQISERRCTAILHTDGVISGKAFCALGFGCCIDDVCRATSFSCNCFCGYQAVPYHRCYRTGGFSWWGIVWTRSDGNLIWFVRSSGFFILADQCLPLTLTPFHRATWLSKGTPASPLSSPSLFLTSYAWNLSPH